MSNNEFLDYADKWASERKSSFGAPILKFKEGRVQFRVLDAKPISRRVHFNSIGEKKTAICPEEGCLFCARGDEVTVQHYMNVVDRADDKVKVLIFTGASLDEISKLIRQVSETSTDPSQNHPRNYDIAVVREGKTRQTTRYTAAQISGVTFNASKYKPYDLSELLQPMPVEEMKKYQSEKPAVSTSRKPKDARKPITSSVPSVEMENMLSEDDSVV